MQQTSLEAYAEVRKKLNRRQADVLACIEEHGPINNRQIGERLHWPINAITPRVLELREKHRVESAYIDKDVTGRRVNFWRVAA